MFAIVPSLLCLLTAHNTAGSGKIGVAEVEEHREVSRLIPGREEDRERERKEDERRERRDGERKEKEEERKKTAFARAPRMFEIASLDIQSTAQTQTCSRILQSFASPDKVVQLQLS